MLLIKELSKKQNIFSIKEINFKNIEILIIYLLIIFTSLYKKINTQINNIQSILYSDSEIILKLKGYGEQSILSSGYYLCPDFIYVNEGSDNKLNNNSCYKIFISLEENQEINIIKLIWNKNAEYTSIMFLDLNN